MLGYPIEIARKKPIKKIIKSFFMVCKFISVRYIRRIAYIRKLKRKKGYMKVSRITCCVLSLNAAVTMICILLVPVVLAAIVVVEPTDVNNELLIVFPSLFVPVIAIV